MAKNKYGRERTYTVSVVDQECDWCDYDELEDCIEGCCIAKAYDELLEDDEPE